MRVAISHNSLRSARFRLQQLQGTKHHTIHLIRCCSTQSGSGSSNKKQNEEKKSGISERFAQWFTEAKEQNPELRQSMEELKETKVGGKTFQDAAEEIKNVAGQTHEEFQKASSTFSKKSSSVASDAFSKAAEHAGSVNEAWSKTKDAFSSTMDSTSSNNTKKENESTDSEQTFNEESTTSSRQSQQKQDEQETSSSDVPKKPSKFEKLTENFKDVLAGVFGVKRAKPVESTVDGPYPWIEYEDTATGKMMYRNTKSGVITDVKPWDFDDRATEVSKVEQNTEQHALVVVQEEKTRWQQYSDRLMQQPIMQTLVAYANEIADSEVGSRVRTAKDSVADRADAVRERFETSQHPLVYNATYAYDSLFSESEQGRALNRMLMIDPGFDEVEFVEEVREAVIPEAVHGFLQGDRTRLSRVCTDQAMSHLNAVFKAREAEKLIQDPTVLSISRVEMIAARNQKSGPPIMLVSAMVQQINCLRNEKGEVVEGSEDEIRAVMYLFAFQREYSERTSELEWRIAEMSMHGSQLYL